MMKNIFILMTCMFLFCACQNRSKVEQLKDILEQGTEQIKQANSREQVTEIETMIQEKINKVSEDTTRLSEEDAAVLGPVLNEYYKAFYDKAMELGELPYGVEDNGADLQASPDSVSNN